MLYIFDNKARTLPRRRRKESAIIDKALLSFHKSNGCYACLSQVAWVHTSDGKQQINAGSIPALLQTKYEY